MPSESLHCVILDAFAKPSIGNWAAQVIEHFRSLGLPAPPMGKSSFCTEPASKHHEVWQGLHVSPRSAPSKVRGKSRVRQGL